MQFRVLGKEELAAQLAASASPSPGAGLSFRMFAPSGAARLGKSDHSYRVFADDGQEQLIELVEAYGDGDNTIWSRYRATRSTVSPVSSRMFHVGYMFGALWYAFAAALILYVAERLLRRKYAPRAAAQVP